MKNYLILSAAALLLASCSASKTGTTGADTVTAVQTTQEALAEDSLIAILNIKDTIKTGEPVELKFTVFNRTDSTRQFCKWHTPFEPPISKYLDIKDEQGNEVNYKGAMAKRVMPPPADSYIKVNVGDSVSANADLLKSYAIDKPGRYTIVYNSKGVSGVIVKDSVSFVYSK
ncbi:protease [Mucilaginibacter limnophilus]|uniref:Protease n=1 Tax=Mucilaginibacter limnophilus TaxID=1932778 RepID=A0A3S2V2Z4_9SPHI|nr:protease [Mucilaginibacter limnophilus]RVU01953.1 protease [Mucilaginibacter limnophilus]